MATDVLANNASTTLTVAVTTTPAAGTVETWTVAASGAPFPVLTGGQQFRATVGPTSDTTPEIILVTAQPSGTTWTVVRGAEGSPVKTHAVTDPIYGTVTAATLAGLPNPVALDQAISVTNLMQDPRATTVANFAISLGGTGTQTQAPTNRVDGYQQVATPQSCVEIAGTSSAASYIGVATVLKTQARTVGLTAGQLVAARVAAKAVGITGVWYATLVINYFNTAGTFLLGVEMAASPNNPVAAGTWFTLEGFDNQSPAGTAYCEIAVLVYPTTVQTVTLRVTEIVMAVDPDGDVPGYVGGDANGGRWLGTADASTSIVNFDPSAVYSATQIFGLTNPDISSPSPIRIITDLTPAQYVRLSKDVGATIARTSVAFSGGNPAAPAISAAQLAWLRQITTAGIPIIIGAGLFPVWMAPTHMPTLSGNGGSITAAATTINVSAAGPVNLAMPFTVSVDSEQMTVTAGSATTAWTVTRGVNGTTAATHSDGARLADVLFNTTFGHVYYPDAAYRATYGTAITNLIAQIGPTNVVGVEAWNEPNLNQVDTRNEGAAGYTAHLNGVYSSVKALYPSIPVLGGVLSALQSTTTTGPTGSTDAVTFLNGMYSASATFDWLDIHYYPHPTGTSGGTTNPDLSSFNRQIKRIADAQAAQSDTRPQFCSEYGGFSLLPSEAVQARNDALQLGRMKRMSNLMGVCHNASVGLAASNDTSWWSQTTMRPRPAARQAAKMNARPALPGQPPAPADLVVDANVVSKATETGVLAQTVDPMFCSGSFAVGSGYMYAFRVGVPERTTVTNALTYVSTVGATLTYARMAVIDSQGNIVALTADQSTLWTSTGLKTMPLTAQTGFSLTLQGGPGQFYWLAYLVTGTTMPRFISTPVGLGVVLHAGFGEPYVASVPGAKHRYAYEPTGGRTAFISLTNLTLSDNYAAQMVWAALT